MHRQLSSVSLQIDITYAGYFEIQSSCWKRTLVFMRACDCRRLSDIFVAFRYHTEPGIASQPTRIIIRAFKVLSHFISKSCLYVSWLPIVVEPVYDATHLTGSPLSLNVLMRTSCGFDLVKWVVKDHPLVCFGFLSKRKALSAAFFVFQA